MRQLQSSAPKGLFIHSLQVKSASQTETGLIYYGAVFGRLFTYQILCARMATSFMRVLGITLPDEKRIEIALTSLYGVGRSRANTILDEAKVSPDKKAKDITPDEENAIKKALETVKIEGDLKREVAGNVKRLKDIKAYRGIRHMRGLPTRGQRTKTNSRTRRGNTRKTMGTGRKVAEKK